MSAAVTKVEHERAARLNVWQFEAAERHAEMLRQSAFAKAALKANPSAFDEHNQATYLAEQEYLRSVIAACAKFGVRDVGWRAALQTLPRPVSAQRWKEGKGNGTKGDLECRTA
jgi:hypothetical protein